MPERKKSVSSCGSGASVREGKIFSCVFFLDVLCSFRLDDRNTFLARCNTCREYLRFEKEMDAEEEANRVFCEAVWANPEAYLRGELR